MTATEQDFRSRAVLRLRGHYFDDFDNGKTFRHHWGRTINEGDNSLFTTLTLNSTPLYFNAQYAKQEGHPSVLVNPMLVFCTVFGLSVEDLSELGIAFLGVDNLKFHAPVYPGDTLNASSEVINRRQSQKNASQGIVTWSTKGFNQHDQLVVEFERTNLLKMRPTE
jgi:itaconyl-CoA hydratase